MAHLEAGLPHLLPPLVADNPGHLSVRVERRIDKA